jgi:NAD(P)-dependent dehydrogenase (short-subunit alcohol dehydrogenase family)
MGLATARAFAEAGAAVVLADINDEAQVAAMVERADASFGRLDMAFNNAGIQVPPSDAADEPAEHFDRVNAINLRGVSTCMKHELRHMPCQAGRPTTHPSTA